MKLLYAVLTFVFLFGKALSQVEVTLGPATATINENDVMTIQCSVVAPAAAEISVALIIAAGTTAEDGFDADNVGSYSCVIPMGGIAGSVDIPTNSDNVLDDGEVYVIHGDAAALMPNTLNAQTPTITITDVPSMDGTMVNIKVRPIEDDIVEESAGTLNIVVDFEDDLGNTAPIEADYQLGLIFTDDSATGGTTGASPDDYDNTPVAADNLIAGVNGAGVTSATITVGITDDLDIENAERFSFRLMADPAPAVAMKVDEQTQYTVTIWDNDKPGIYILNSNAALPRKTKKTVEQIVFTGEANNGITLTTSPFTPDVTERLLPGYNGRRYVLPPSMEGRFTGYSFRTMETVNGNQYELTAGSFISATNRRPGPAPINSDAGSTVTVFPTAGDTIDAPVTICVDGRSFQEDLRWEFTNQFGFTTKLYELAGRASYTITMESQAGLYTIFRRRRRERGWVHYFRVIISDCPKGMYHDAGTCDGGPIVCQHGGIVDPAYKALCTCPPGFIGPLCQYPLDIPRNGGVRFGHNGQYDVSTFPKFGKGRGVTFSFKHPFGTTCAPGYFGAGCEKSCENKGRFGPRCEFECRCADSVCGVTGICKNGCKVGFQGPTCQIPV